MALPLLEVRALRAAHGRRTVLHGVDLRVDEPGVVLLGGANGAGKTTLLRSIGSLHRAAGEVLIDGRRGRALPDGRPAIGYLPQAPDFPRRFRVRELLEYQAFLSRVPVDEGDAAIAEAAARLGIEGLLDRRLRALSGGEQRLAHVAGVLIGSPRVVLVDEPSAGLDAAHRVALRAALSGAAEHAVVLVVTHAPDDYELLASRVVYLRGGRVAFDGDRAAFLALGDDEADDGPRRSRAERAIAALEGRELAEAIA